MMTLSNLIVEKPKLYYRNSNENNKEWENENAETYISGIKATNQNPMKQHLFQVCLRL